ncbi:MAG: histidine kinase [Cyanobacteria bacterium P01_G01_bin.4]
MSSLKETIASNIGEIKHTGADRLARIRQIFRDAVRESLSEFEEGSSEIRSIASEAASVALSTLIESGADAKAEVSASLDGIVDAVGERRRTAISKAETDAKQLQAVLDREMTDLQADVDEAIGGIEASASSTTPEFKELLDSAIASIRGSEESALIAKRYAQLQAQLSILRANLSARYGDRFDEIGTYIEDAKEWYRKAKEAPDAATETIQQKHDAFENLLAEAGSAIAKREQRVRSVLKNLLSAAAEAL